jgi:hypothetical protein
MPDMIFVDSSNVQAIGYDGAAEDLHVQFVDRGYYIYHQVPQNIFDALMAAPSKGSFLNREVRGIYQFTKQ